MLFLKANYCVKDLENECEKKHFIKRVCSKLTRGSELLGGRRTRVCTPRWLRTGSHDVWKTLLVRVVRDATLQWWQLVEMSLSRPSDLRLTVVKRHVAAVHTLQTNRGATVWLYSGVQQRSVGDRKPARKCGFCSANKVRSLSLLNIILCSAAKQNAFPYILMCLFVI